MDDGLRQNKSGSDPRCVVLGPVMDFETLFAACVQKVTLSFRANEYNSSWIRKKKTCIKMGNT